MNDLWVYFNSRIDDIPIWTIYAINLGGLALWVGLTIRKVMQSWDTVVANPNDTEAIGNAANSLVFWFVFNGMFTVVLMLIVALLVHMVYNRDKSQ